MIFENGFRIILLFLTLVILGNINCLAIDQQEDLTIKVGVSPVVSSAGIFLAYENGFF